MVRCLLISNLVFCVTYQLFFTGFLKKASMNINEVFKNGTALNTEIFFSVGVVRSSILGITLLIAVVGICLESIWNSRSTKIPPGPRNLLELAVKFRSCCLPGNVDIDLGSKIMKAEYGKIVGFFSFFTKIVIINDFEILQMTFKNPAVLGRPPNDFFQLIEDGVSRGIAASSGKTWHEIRKFTITQLSNLGLKNKKRLNLISSGQVEQCVSILRESIGQPFSTKHFFDILVVNNLWEIISGQRFFVGDPQVRRLMYWFQQMSESGIQAAILSRHPRLASWVLFFLGTKNPFPEAKKHIQAFILNFLGNRVKPRATFENDRPTSETKEDFTEAFINKIQSTKDVNSPFYGKLGYENFQEVVRDLLVAGSETVSNTLSWALLYLALHPEKQEKLFKEIDTVLGTQIPSLDDRPRMKYTEAVINETLRKSSLAALGIPHATTEDTFIGEFHVSKGTMVFGNVYAIHHSEKTWGDPDLFRPERFLTDDETALVKYDELVPFGTGKRICPGMSFAYSELFLFIVRIFQEFTITLNPAEPKPEMRPKFGITLTPAPHTLIITERTSHILQ